MLWIMFDKYLRGEQWGNHNSARPKVPRRDSLGAGPVDSNNPLFTGTASALGWGHVRPGQAAKNCTCTTSSKCTVSIRHGRNKPTRPQLGHTWPNFGPTWLQNGARNKFGPSWSPYGFKMDDKPAQSEILKIPVFTRIFHFFCYQWRFVWKGPKLHHCGRDLDFYVHHLASSWVHLHRFGPNFGWPFGPFRAQVRLSPSQFCGPNATRWKLAFLPLFPTFFWLSWPNFGTRCPHTGPWRAS